MYVDIKHKIIIILGDLTKETCGKVTGYLWKINYRETIGYVNIQLQYNCLQDNEFIGVIKSIYVSKIQLYNMNQSCF